MIYNFDKNYGIMFIFISVKFISLYNFSMFISLIRSERYITYVNLLARSNRKLLIIYKEV